MTLVNRQCRLAGRPGGLPKPTDWAFTEEPMPSPADGEFLVQVEYLSIDPAMRTWMNAGRSYVPPVEIGEVMRAAGIGGGTGRRRLGGRRVYASRAPPRAGPRPSRRPRHQRPDRLLRAARRRKARAG